MVSSLSFSAALLMSGRIPESLDWYHNRVAVLRNVMG